MLRLTPPVALSLALLSTPACLPHVASRAVDTGARLLLLAGEEAALVPSHGERLTRLLNVAHRQLQRGHADDARVALRQARSTLQESPSLEEHARLSAWVSLSELSRRARDSQAAREASAEATRFLRALQPVARRTEYVRGLALELRYLDGEAPAVSLLREGASWAAAIDDPQTRRRAYTSIAWDLFLCEDFDGGRDVLRRDTDAAWRSDTLTTLATIGGQGHVQVQLLGGRASASRSVKRYDFQGASVSAPSTAPASVRFGRAVDFESNYLKR